MRYSNLVGLTASTALLSMLLWIRTSSPDGLPGYMIVGGVVSFFYMIWSASNLFKSFGSKF